MGGEESFEEDIERDEKGCDAVSWVGEDLCVSLPFSIFPLGL